MKTLGLALVSLCSLALAQDPSELFDKAPPPVDEALRARVHDFYQAHIDGKFREAYKLVAEDSQEVFFAMAKQQYKDCETARINYSEQFTKALVVETCKADWMFHGQTLTTTLPISSNWKVVDGQWYWYYVKPTVVASPFSPNGSIFSQDTANAKPGNAPVVPPDPTQLARGILAMIKIDKTSVSLRSDQASEDEIHIHNDMPGAVSISIDPVTVPGLKVTLAKAELQAKEDTAVHFEYHTPEGGGAKAPSQVTVQVHVSPTGQVFPVQVSFSSKQQDAK